MQHRPGAIASHLGLLRTTRGLADVHLDDETLRLVVHEGALALLDRYRRVPVVAAALLALAGVFTAGAVQVALLAVAALALVVASIGFGRAPRTTVHDLARAGLSTSGPVHGVVRPRLTLATSEGELTLAGWPWRRRALERLETPG